MSQPKFIFEAEQPKSTMLYEQTTLEEAQQMEAKKTSLHEQLAGTNHLTVRQNRFESEGSFEVDVSGRKYKILNYSLFGLAFHTDQAFEVGAALDHITIYCGNQPVVSSGFKVKRCKKIDFGYEIGVESLHNSLPVETILRIKDFNALVSGLDEKNNYYQRLPDAFKTALLDLSVRLDHFEKYVKNFSEKEFINSHEYHSSKEALIEVVSKQIIIELYQTTEKLKNCLQSAQGDLFKVAFAYFREHIGRHLFQSPFTKRSYEKPRGYAGDYVMMSQIYANDAYAPTLFGSCMEKAVQSFGEPSAVRNRSRYLSRKLYQYIQQNGGRPLKFLSVASGPAEEVRLLIQQLTQQELDLCEFSLLDQDEGALQYAQKTILEHAMENHKKVNLKLINRGIKEILVAGLGEQKFDMIYSAGLFDYFTDIVATKASQLLGRHLTEKGLLIIGNFNIANTNWFGMLALFDWSLILRSHEDLSRLFKNSKNQVVIESEDKNINLFCCITNS